MFRKSTSAHRTTLISEGSGSSFRGSVPAFLAGSAVGFFAAAVLTRRPRRDPEAVAAWTLAGGWEQLAAAWQEMLETWTVALERTPAVIDLEALSDRLRALPGGEAVTVRRLGSGIVELTGDLPAAEESARALLEAVAEEAGVNVVLNRIWLGGDLPSDGREPEVPAGEGPE